MIDIHLLEQVHAFYEYGTLSSAAEKLHTSQPALTRAMKKLEEDLVNKKVNKQTIERNREIISRMLESEKAQQKRDQEEKRKSNEYKGSRFDRQVDELLYKQHLKKNQDFLEQNPIQYFPYYKAKINEYYLKKNLH